MKQRIVIIGGGTGGITAAARLHRQLPDASISIIEPARQHSYQPFWTLVAAGIVPKEASARDQASVIPRGVEWLQTKATSMDPDARTVTLADNRTVQYDYLIVAPGLQLDWHKIKGLPETLGENGVCSIYDYRQAERTWDMLRDFKGGHAIFTAPATPVKCGGAPQKIMFLAEETFVRQGVRDKSQVSFLTAGSVIFGVKSFAAALQKVADRVRLDYRFKHNLIEVRPETHEAVFEVTTAQGTTQNTVNYALLHVVPPMSAPEFIQRSPLAHQDGPQRGWLNVDPHTLQHPVYPTVFGLGDVIGTTNAKTGAAIRKQAPVLVHNLIAHLRGQPLKGAYDGYSSCPLVTGRGRLILAEFDYRNQPKPSFPIDTAKERFDMYLLKRYVLPLLYWYGMLRGRA